MLAFRNIFSSVIARSSVFLDSVFGALENYFAAICFFGGRSPKLNCIEKSWSWYGIPMATPTEPPNQPEESHLNQNPTKPDQS